MAKQQMGPSLLQRRLDSIDAKLAAIAAQLNTLTKAEQTTMATLADITAAVNNETSVIGSVTTLLTQLSSQLKDALASEDPAQIQAVLDSINANATALANAVAANTPATPTPAPAPAPAPAGT